uniref:MFS domain-containing protein n=1 Tax=Angiostrongylus cantonensis TaxID=6313 RepID=A0A0K0DEU2_ANGCA
MGVKDSSSKLVPIPPDGGWGWVVVLGSFFVHVFADGFVYSFGVLVEVLMKEFNSDNTVCAMIISLLTGLTLGSGPLASAVCNKYGCRTTTIVGAFIASIGCAMSYFATAMWHIVFSVGVIMGIGFGLMYCPAIVIVTMYFEKRRSLATGFAVAGAGVGTVLFSPINEYIITHYGWRAVFLAFLGILGLCVLCGWTFRPLRFREIRDSDEIDDIEEAKKPERTIVEVVLYLIATDVVMRKRCETVGERDVGYLNRKDVFYTGSITNVAEFNEHPDKFRSTGSLHRRTVSVTVSMSVEKLKEVKEGSEEVSEDTDNTEGKHMFRLVVISSSFRFWNRLWIYNISLSLCGVLTAFCYLCSDFVSLSVYAGLFGFSISSYICLTSVILVDILGLEKLTNAFGLLLLWQGIGTVFGPPVSGYLADLTNTYVWSFVFCGVNLLVSGMMLFSIPYFREKKRRLRCLKKVIVRQTKRLIEGI